MFNFSWFGWYINYLWYSFSVPSSFTVGDSGDNTFTGNIASSVYYCNGGDDILVGGAGARDILIGGADNDVLDAQSYDGTDSRVDEMWGGDGSDTFVVSSGTVLDFSLSEDKIRVDASDDSLTFADLTSSEALFRGTDRLFISADGSTSTRITFRDEKVETGELYIDNIRPWQLDETHFEIV